MKLRKTVVLAIPFLLSFAGSGAAQQQPKPGVSQIRVIEYNGALPSLLGSLAESYNVIIGFEQDSRLPNRAVRISVKDATIRDALDAIVQNRPEYQWREVEGVFQVMPVTSSSQFLETKILKFQVSNSMWTIALNILIALPEVQQAMSSLQITREDSPRPSEQGGQPFSLQLENITFRQALNEMTRKSGRYFWQYSERGGKTRSFSVSN